MAAHAIPRRRSLWGAFVDWNATACRALDRALPASWSVRGGADFSDRIVPPLIEPGMMIWDVGCGSRPFVSPERKAALRLRVVGCDIDQGELDKMPAGSCDWTFAADLCAYWGRGDADLVICKTVLEHVADVDAAFAALVSMTRPGGTIAVRVPCRNAWFARLNLMLPERLKRRILFSVKADDGHSGFPARYDRCTPGHFRALAVRHGLELVELRAYWYAPYFYFFAPLWAAWRLWQACARPLAGDAVCETFTMVVRKPDAATPPDAPA
ncbi:MAG: class I SAM-dependent methyltransferase [Hyphomicrobiaceae bacterium]